MIGLWFDKKQLAPPRYLYQQLTFLLLALILEVRRMIIDYNQFCTYTNRHGEVNIGLNIGCPDHPIVTLLKIIFVCCENFLDGNS